jgi:hypothetical protein
VVVERPVGCAVVILAAVIVQAGGHGSSCSSSSRMRPPAAVSCFDLLSSCQLPVSGLLATPRAGLDKKNKNLQNSTVVIFVVI